MKFFGWHWLAHLLAVALLAGGYYLGKNRLAQTQVLKTELSGTQSITLQAVRRIKENTLYAITEAMKSYPCPWNDRIHATAVRAAAAVEAFERKVTGSQPRLYTGTPPRDSTWPDGLLDDYYRLGDSLAACYGDSLGRAWLGRCLFNGYRSYPREKPAALLSRADTAGVGQICRNLQLRAELALVFMLEYHRKQLRRNDLRFDKFIPMLNFEACPQAGVPFEADVSLAFFSASARNVRYRINGMDARMKEAGLLQHNAVFEHPGTHTLPVEIMVRNPLTGDIRLYRKDFKVEVTEGAGQ